MEKPSEIRLTRRGVVTVSLLAALGLSAVVYGTDRLLSKDYGCSTATVGKDIDAIATAQQAAAKVAPLDPQLHSAITEQTHAIAGSEFVQPGDQVTTCVQIDPILGFGDGGWIVDVTIAAPVPHN